MHHQCNFNIFRLSSRCVCVWYGWCVWHVNRCGGNEVTSQWDTYVWTNIYSCKSPLTYSVNQNDLTKYNKQIKIKRILFSARKSFTSGDCCCCCCGCLCFLAISQRDYAGVARATNRKSWTHKVRHGDTQTHPTCIVSVRWVSSPCVYMSCLLAASFICIWRKLVGCSEPCPRHPSYIYTNLLSIRRWWWCPACPAISFRVSLRFCGWVFN